MTKMLRCVRSLGVFLLCGLSLFPLLPAVAAETTTLRIGYVGQARDLPPALSNLDQPPADEGLLGARLGILDNNTTGRFTGQRFELVERHLPVDGDPGQAVAELAAAGLGLVVLDLSAASLDRVLARPDVSGLLLFNAGASDDRFRDRDCRANVLHTLPSRAMQADALAQYLITKRWTAWFLVTGPRPEDALFAAALHRSARKFGAQVVAEKRWTGDHDARRTAQAEVPLFTQGVDYHVLMVADESGDFGYYLPYRTWQPRLVAGTQGLIAAAWGRPVEQWGASQLQERFFALGQRWMRPRDYAAWAAVRSIGEAATRTASDDVTRITAYLRSEAFQLAAFKGRKLSYRPWNGQLRQPMPVMTESSLVAQPPLEGFLHQFTDLDTLGLDAPESACRHTP